MCNAVGEQICQIEPWTPRFRNPSRFSNSGVCHIDDCGRAVLFSRCVAEHVSTGSGSSWELLDDEDSQVGFTNCCPFSVHSNFVENNAHSSLHFFNGGGTRACVIVEPQSDGRATTILQRYSLNLPYGACALGCSGAQCVLAPKL